MDRKTKELVGGKQAAELAVTAFWRQPCRYPMADRVRRRGMTGGRWRIRG